MRVNNPIVRTALCVLLAGATLRGDTRARKPFMPAFPTSPRSAGTAPKQKPATITANSRSRLSEIEKAECYSTFREIAMQAQEFGLFNSTTWKDFNDLMSSLNNRELIGFASINSNGSSLIQCVLALDDLKRPVQPFSNHREMIMFAAYFNLVGYNIKQTTHIDYQAGTKETSMSIAPLSLDRNELRRNMGIVKRLSANLSSDSDVFILCQHSVFMWAENTRIIRPPFEERLKSFGKWEILAGSLSEAEDFVAALLPYIESGDIGSLKFDLDPHTIDDSEKTVYRIIAYTRDHNSVVEKILRRLSNRVFWVYEWQTIDGFILDKALSIFYSSSKSLEESEEKELMAKLKDKKLMNSLGLSNFQIQLLEEIIRISKKDTIIDFSNPLTYSAFEIVRATDNIAIGLIVEALKPKNHEAFKAHLKKLRQAGKSMIFY